MSSQDNGSPLEGESDAGAATPPGLRRRESNRIFAGVCAGLGERLAIDANIVRVGFVVATLLWGVGLVAYLALWILVPLDSESSATESLPRFRPSPAALAVVVVLALFFFAATVVRHVVSDPRPPSWGVGPGPFPVWVIILVVVALFSARRRGHRIRVLRFFVWMAGAVVTGLILVGLAVGAYAWSTGVPLSGGTGSREWQLSTSQSLNHAYRTAVGSETLDLSGVHLTPESSHTLNASVGVGRLTITVPRTLRITVNTHVGVGSTVLQHLRSPFVILPGLGGVTGRHDAHLTINASVGVGRLEISRW